MNRFHYTPLLIITYALVAGGCEVAYPEHEVLGLANGKAVTIIVPGVLVEDLKQHSVSANVITRLLKPILVNLTYEGLFESIRTSGRLLLNLTFRF